MPTPRNNVCDCGKPATLRKCGYRVCADCDRIERMQFNDERRHHQDETPPSTETYYVALQNLPA